MTFCLYDGRNSRHFFQTWTLTRGRHSRVLITLFHSEKPIKNFVVLFSCAWRQICHWFILLPNGKVVYSQPKGGFRTFYFPVVHKKFPMLRHIFPPLTYCIHINTPLNIQTTDLLISARPQRQTNAKGYRIFGDLDQLKSKDTMQKTVD